MPVRVLTEELHGALLGEIKWNGTQMTQIQQICTDLMPPSGVPIAIGRGQEREEHRGWLRAQGAGRRAQGAGFASRSPSEGWVLGAWCWVDQTVQLRVKLRATPWLKKDMRYEI